MSDNTNAAQGVETIASIRARAERDINRHQRAIESLTANVGRPRTLYAVVAIAVGWTSLNLILPVFFGRAALDPPPFFWLQGCVAFFAVIMTTLVLITENRQTRYAEERAHLDLQVNLLTEQKVAKLIALVEELRRDLPMVRDRVDSEAESMQQSVDPQAMLAELEKTVAGNAGGEEEEEDDDDEAPSGARAVPRARADVARPARQKGR